jgi:hypothetical protein
MIDSETFKELESRLRSARRAAQQAYEFGAGAYNYEALNSLVSAAALLDEMAPTIVQRLS